MFTVPAPSGKSYLPYQLAFIKYALGGPGTLLADDMGLGKTIQAIGLINAMKTKQVLIVAPAGLILNWKNECSDWLVPLQGQQIHFATYHQAESLSHLKPNLLIVDEAHYIKNPQAKRTQAIRTLAKQAERILLMTGTPIENRPIELWPLVQMVAPKEFDPPNTTPWRLTPEHRASHPGEGAGFWEFAKRYCGLKKAYFRKGGRQRSAFDFSGATNLVELKARLVRTCLVRRLKDEVLKELPGKRRQVIVLPVKGVDDSSMLEDLNEENYSEQVRRLVADKILFETYAKQRHAQALKKVPECLTLIENALECSAKLIVFAHHQDVISKLEEGINIGLKEGESSVVVTGKTHVADRGAAVVKFQTDPKCRVFIGSIGAAGVGITLTAASHVIFVELDPTPGKMNQAEDRAHRIGQRNSVLVWHLVADGSLCARIAKILVKKQEIINTVLDV